MIDFAMLTVTAMATGWAIGFLFGSITYQIKRYSDFM